MALRVPHVALQANVRRDSEFEVRASIPKITANS
jgi:hypothetical protein